MSTRVEKYTPALKDVWNGFVQEAKNGLFLFARDYMEYHADRFTDHSLLFYKEEKLLAVMPATEKGDLFSTHAGLTFGGFVLSKRATALFVMEAFNALLGYLKSNCFSGLVYKAIPFIYHTLPAQEDLYSLFRHNAVLYRRDLSSIIELTEKISYTKGTKSNLSKARKADLRIVERNDFDLFMPIQEELLRTRFNTKPTHTAAELAMLAERFPDNIKLYLTFKENECMGGTVTYETGKVIHTQYIAITDAGKEVGALDFMTDHLLTKYKDSKRYFSFGISTVNEGKELNEGLISNKESFGARSMVLDFYKINIA